MVRKGKVREIMSPAPVCMASTESVSAAAQAMRRHGTGTVLVVSGGGFSGIVTDRDIAVQVLADSRDPEATRLGDIRGGELAVLGPDDDVEQAAWLLRDCAVRRVAVLAGRTPVGVVSIGDLLLSVDDRGRPALSGVQGR
jgi:CBS domain-containing protein